MLFALVLSLFWGTNPLWADACCTSCAQGKMCVDPSEPEVQNAQKPQKRYPTLLVFVSWGMPLASLKDLGAQVSKLGGMMVFRGLLESSFRKTAEKLKELGTSATLDPTLFEAYGVKAVPTFIVRTEETDTAEDRPSQDRMTGNVTLVHALEQFAEKGEARHEAARLLEIHP